MVRLYEWRAGANRIILYTVYGQWESMRLIIFEKLKEYYGWFVYIYDILVALCINEKKLWIFWSLYFQCQRNYFSFEK